MGENGNYSYPAVITDNGDGADIYFPDFDQMTCSETMALSDITTAAQEMLGLLISDALDCGTPLPEPVMPEASEGMVMMVNVWLPYHRSQETIAYTKKTLTIPVWLDILAKERNVNFSAALVRALKEELGLR